LIDDNGCLRRRWKYKLLVYDNGDHDWGRSWLDLGFWLHLWLFNRSIGYLWYFLLGKFFFTLCWDNISIIIYLFDVEILVEATLSSIAADADVTLKRDITVLESTGAVKLAIHLVFSSV
jgi:hypothetical protein